MSPNLTKKKLESNFEHLIKISSFLIKTSKNLIKQEIPLWIIIASHHAHP